MKGLHVLLTGSAGGIGITTAKHFLAAGAVVSLHYNKQNDTLAELESQYPNHTVSIRYEGLYMSGCRLL